MNMHQNTKWIPASWLSGPHPDFRSDPSNFIERRDHRFFLSAGPQRDLLEDFTHLTRPLSPGDEVAFTGMVTFDNIELQVTCDSYEASPVSPLANRFTLAPWTDPFPTLPLLIERGNNDGSLLPGCYSVENWWVTEEPQIFVFQYRWLKASFVRK
ncbi:hypothetical protein NAC44_20930 [Allorhizobium sp. BGMRC 0089]|uniref:hypothetical protein n=1 Tax=Allorhizobium sonneratiae TaxID=2934936 RepID=UPI00203403B5|nr:hypothetical protein [Allorhizobium sonneratiae]MCM2294795.1 hypothetical protein [Allorhizobium sonneratiae]